MNMSWGGQCTGSCAFNREPAILVVIANTSVVVANTWLVIAHTLVVIVANRFSARGAEFVSFFEGISAVCTKCLTIWGLLFEGCYYAEF